MQPSDLIVVTEFCTHYHVDFSFLHSLNQHGLIEIITIEGTGFIHPDQLPYLEKLVRLHYHMDINIEGIETISHLLRRISDMQHQLADMKGRLGLYE